MKANASKRSAHSRCALMRTEGQRLLVGSTAGMSISSIAKRVGAGSRANVRAWLTGSITPRAAMRARIESAFGVSRDAWSRSIAPANTEPNVDLEPAPKIGLGTTLEDCRSLQADVRALRCHPTLCRRDRSQVVACESRILALRVRLESEADLRDPKQIASHPRWLRLQSIMLRALVPYPEARRVVVEAIASALPPDRATNEPTLRR